MDKGRSQSLCTAYTTWLVRLVRLGRWLYSWALEQILVYASKQLEYSLAPNKTGHLTKEAMVLVEAIGCMKSSRGAKVLIVPNHLVQGDSIQSTFLTRFEIPSQLTDFETMEAQNSSSGVPIIQKVNWTDII